MYCIPCTDFVSFMYRYISKYINIKLVIEKPTLVNLSRYTGIQERGDDDYNKQGILMDDKRRLHRNTGKNIQTALTHDINNNPQVTLGRTDLYRET